jgi:hypothetical protein
MKSQATRCTQQELAFLAYWQSKGYTFKRGDPVPLNTVTPPSLATRRPVLDVVLALAGIVTVLALAGTWLAKAAGLL